MFNSHNENLIRQVVNICSIYVKHLDGQTSVNIFFIYAKSGIVIIHVVNVVIIL